MYEKLLNKENILDREVPLNNPETGLVLKNDDIESVHPLDKLPKETLGWKAKEGFPTYHFNPETRLLIIYPSEELGNEVQAYILKEDSEFIKAYSKRYK